MDVAKDAMAYAYLGLGNNKRALDALEQWLQHGPAQAQVERVSRSAIDPATVEIGAQFHTL